MGPIKNIALIHQEGQLSLTDKDFIKEIMVAYVSGGGEPSNKLNIYNISENSMVLQSKAKSEICDIISRENR